MNSRRDPLDVALEALPREVAPTRDLWAGIEAEIAGPSPVVRRPSSALWMRLAAGVVLVIASSLTTYVITRQIVQENVLQAQRATEMHQPVVPAMPASFAQQALGAEYLQARAALDAEFQRQVATLPPVTRAKLERNLADLRRAASEISATLAEHPSHPLLQELLLSTYQSELALLGSVTDMNVPVLTSSPSETRL
ncbi:MAG TPA: hypothetical protein PKE27_05585 [Povalibacter sp.]|uniref:hypothetical protein n=1 Tax=Povalibacter sp. TaxID=1962978 RepID=UPI002BA63ADB|nr:hypothetical protein [Povalibacter sp.]HMN44021.1 hypothetical protein [Povalibacter sp.]